MGHHQLQNNREFVQSVCAAIGDYMSDSFPELVIVHSTLVALRAYDTVDPVNDIRDFELAGEREIFGA